MIHCMIQYYRTSLTCCGIFCGFIWYGIVWCGKAWRGMVWYGMPYVVLYLQLFVPEQAEPHGNQSVLFSLKLQVTVYRCKLPEDTSYFITLVD